MKPCLKKIFHSLWCFFLVGLASHGDCSMRCVGSTTLFPILSSIAEHFHFQGLGTPPLVESTGTGGGLALFCSAMDNAPMFVAASRSMNPREAKQCRENGRDFYEIDLGFDGIALITSDAEKVQSLPLKDLQKALDPTGALPTLWSDLGESYLSMPIRILGPPGTSGTKEALMHLLNLKSLRQDGVYHAASDQETVLFQKLIIERGSYGVVSFAFLQKNQGVYACPMDGVLPTKETISRGTYPLSRRLYLYINKERLENTYHAKAFMAFLLSPTVTAPHGLMAFFGLIPHGADHYTDTAKMLGL